MLSRLSKISLLFFLLLSVQAAVSETLKVEVHISDETLSFDWKNFDQNQTRFALDLAFIDRHFYLTRLMRESTAKNHLPEILLLAHIFQNKYYKDPENRFITADDIDVIRKAFELENVTLNQLWERVTRHFTAVCPRFDLVTGESVSTVTVEGTADLESKLWTKAAIKDYNLHGARFVPIQFEFNEFQKFIPHHITDLLNLDEIVAFEQEKQAEAENEGCANGSDLNAEDDNREKSDVDGSESKEEGARYSQSHSGDQSSEEEGDGESEDEDGSSEEEGTSVEEGSGSDDDCGSEDEEGSGSEDDSETGDEEESETLLSQDDLDHQNTTVLNRLFNLHFIAATNKSAKKTDEGWPITNIFEWNEDEACYYEITNNKPVKIDDLNQYHQELMAVYCLAILEPSVEEWLELKKQFPGLYVSNLRNKEENFPPIDGPNNMGRFNPWFKMPEDRVEAYRIHLEAKKKNKQIKRELRKTRRIQLLREQNETDSSEPGPRKPSISDASITYIIIACIVTCAVFCGLLWWLYKRPVSVTTLF